MPNRPWSPHWPLAIGAAALLLAAAAPDIHADPRALLSWGAPWGTRNARSFVMPACGDTARDDTLFLCFDPGKDTTLVGLTATLWFRPGDNDTLGHAWHFEDKTLPRLRAFFNDLPGGPVHTPWGGAGYGGARYHSLTQAGALRMIWAVSAKQPARVDSGTVYLFARVAVPRPRDPAECARPMCIQWATTGLSYTTRTTVQAHAGALVVAWNSPNGAACQALKQNPTQPWIPAKPKERGH